MQPIDCPFVAAKNKVAELREKTKIIIVDIHAEATSEKKALGWYLDGEVSAVLGTHTHVQTADEEIFPQGTAYISDAGMTGPFDSVIGINKETIIERFLTQMPNKFDVAKDDIRMQGVIMNIDSISGKANSIERISIKLKD
jgi:metallophosphoesterase (TIGR00282 family)